MSNPEQARFRPGDPVRIDAREHRGHHRVPQYLKGRTGVVEHLIAVERNPETLAYGQDGTPRIQVYQVRFDQRDLWSGYEGGKVDTLTVDIHEHWLDPIEG